MSFKVDRAEILEARNDYAEKLTHWRLDQSSSGVTTEDLLDAYEAWLGLVVAYAIQERDERGSPWP